MSLDFPSENPEMKFLAKPKTQLAIRKILQKTPIPDVIIDIIISFNFYLYPHQIKALDWMSSKSSLKGGILALKQGLGKTLTSLVYMMKEKTLNLVVCSKTIQNVWVEDIKKFYGNRIKYLLFHSDNLKKSINTVPTDIFKNYNIVIVTYDTILSGFKKNPSLSNEILIQDDLGRVLGIRPISKPTSFESRYSKGHLALFKTCWNNIFVDESHRFANPHSITFRSMMALYGEKCWCLSGTPLRNYTTDLYSQFRFIGFSEVLIPSQFTKTIFDNYNLKESIFTMNYKEAGIELPAVEVNVVKYTLEDREKEIYDYYENVTRVVYEQFMIGGIHFSSVLVMFLRLRQICISAYTVLEESSRNPIAEDTEYTQSQEALDNLTAGLASWIRDKTGTAGINSAKITRIIDLIRSIPAGEKVVVFTMFKKVVDILELAIQTSLENIDYSIIDGDVINIDRDRILNQFKHDPNKKVLLITYKVGSEGLNITEANNIILCENWWCPAVMEQAISRSHRMGQTQKVKVWQLLADNTIEMRIEAICNKKLNLIDEFISTKSFKSSSSIGLDKYTIGRLIGYIS
jgi:SNF2 family DNA or RNA helicase